MPELTDGRAVGERAFGPEISHAERLLRRAAGGDDFAEDRFDLGARQRPRVLFPHPVEHPLLASEIENRVDAIDT